MPTEPEPAQPGGEDSTSVGRAQQQLLRSVHDHLRDELGQLREVIERVSDGAAAPGVARDVINRLTMRANYWALGSFCATYCRVVTIHHAIEDQVMFPGLASREPGLGPVVTRLGEEHEAVAGLLSALDDALVAMVTAGDGVDQVRARTDELATRLLAHLDYEEEQLLPVIGRLTDRVV